MTTPNSDRQEHILPKDNQDETNEVAWLQPLSGLSPKSPSVDISQAFFEAGRQAALKASTEVKVTQRRTNQFTRFVSHPIWSMTSGVLAVALVIVLSQQTVPNDSSTDPTGGLSTNDQGSESSITQDRDSELAQSSPLQDESDQSQGERVESSNGSFSRSPQQLLASSSGSSPLANLSANIFGMTLSEHPSERRAHSNGSRILSPGRTLRRHRTNDDPMRHFVHLDEPWLFDSNSNRDTGNSNWRQSRSPTRGEMHRMRSLDPASPLEFPSSFD